MPFSNQNDIIRGETPFKPEYEEFIDKFKGRGSLKIQVSVADEAFPVKGVFVDVALVYGDKRFSIYHDVTDSSGIVNEIVLPSAQASENLNPETAGKNEASYLVSLYHPAFAEVIDTPVVIQDRIETILPVSLSPLPGGAEGAQ